MSREDRKALAQLKGKYVMNQANKGHATVVMPSYIQWEDITDARK